MSDKAFKLNGAAVEAPAVAKGVQEQLRFGVDRKMAAEMTVLGCHAAENHFYYKKTQWRKELKAVEDGVLTYYDSVSGLPVFIAPRGRSLQQFLDETDKHGWPSFRDQEVVWENCHVVGRSELATKKGTHLGHNLPDRTGANRYCINLVCVAGLDPAAASAAVGASIAAVSTAQSDIE